MNLLPDVIDIFESDGDDDFESVERRLHTIKNKPNNFRRWDNTEFFERYRLRRGKFPEVELNSLEIFIHTSFLSSTWLRPFFYFQQYFCILR